MNHCRYCSLLPYSQFSKNLSAENGVSSLEIPLTKGASPGNTNQSHGQDFYQTSCLAALQKGEQEPLPPPSPSKEKSDGGRKATGSFSDQLHSALH